jgi:redox-sensitive bicupin YhaK (pirin superfamily)
MVRTRKVEYTGKSVPTMEGAGVRLKRAVGHSQVPDFDPFLLLDDFHSENPEDYLAGFPWHPHRGIETVTYVLHGNVKHGDSIGNSGAILDGDVQWMTAGSGILHQEMPQKVKGDMRGLQLWVNLPSARKMMEPRYRDIKNNRIPVVKTDDGTVVRIVAGSFQNNRGPVRDLVQDPSYLDVTMGPRRIFVHEVLPTHTVFAYVLEGSGRFEEGSGEGMDAETVLLYGKGDQVNIESGDDGLRFLLISGEPIGEPVAWGGPIVMNTQEELNEAFRELRKGTFIKNIKNNTLDFNI